jgi:hypothetical protein
MKAARDAWFPVVTEHLGVHVEHLESSAWGVSFDLPAEGSAYNTDIPGESAYQTFGRIGFSVADGALNPLDGCEYLRAHHRGTPEEEESCRTQRFAAPGGERARVSSWGRRCTTWEGGWRGVGQAPATCGDYAVTVAVKRPDALIGYVLVEGRGTPDFNPFTRDAMAAAAADPGLTLPEEAFTVPSDQAVVSVVADHFPRFEVADRVPSTPHPGYAHTSGRLGRRGLWVQVWPAGGAPSCGGSWLVECVERRVYGADDPTTVYVGAWDEEDWAGCCPRNSRAASRELVYVGPRHDVVVSQFMVVRAAADSMSADLDQRLIDLVLDPRLQ